MVFVGAGTVSCKALDNHFVKVTLKSCEALHNFNQPQQNA